MTGSGACYSPDFGQADPVPIHIAYQTLLRGTRFLAALPSASPGPEERPQAEIVLPPKLLGNGLRELDRFLDELVLETGHQTGINAAAGGRRTEQRLRHLRDGLSCSDPDQDRLRGLARSRTCLFYCNGVVRRGDQPGNSVMTSGWHVGAPGMSSLRRVDVGQVLAVSFDDLAEVCGYYERLAAELLDYSGFSGH